MLYIITFISILFVTFIIRLIFIKIGLSKLENDIKKAFNARTNMIPAIFDVTKNSFSKHDLIFEDILKYRKKELYKYYSQEDIDNKENDFIKLLHIEKLIHHELNFIFKVANKHPKLAKKWNFIYLRELIIDKSYYLWNKLDEYKQKMNMYNYLIGLKKFTIVWIFIPIYKKTKF